MEKRRRAADWARIVESWQQSGASAKVFAARIGVRPGTLTWWRWRLDKAAAPAAAADVRLVRVDVSPELEAAGAPERGGGWQLVTRAGALRVDAPLRGADLSIVLAALMGQKARAR